MSEEKANHQGRLRSKGLTLYAAIFMIICLLPFVGMLWAPTQSTSSTTRAVALPELLQDDGTVNVNYLSQLGTYFEDHYAYRNLAIDLDARLKVGLFGVSPTKQVVVGSDGWLYYGGELDDYLALSPLTERKAKNIAFNLSLMQGYAKAKGSKLIFTIGPNKSTLYPEHMPYYFPRSPDPSMDLLKECLEEKGVTYLDLFELFDAQSEELYCKTDSHWDNNGALLVTNALLELCGKDRATVQHYFRYPFFIGDIEKMLYPVTAQPEPQTGPSTGDWNYVNSASTVDDVFIETGSSGAASSSGSSDTPGSSGASSTAGSPNPAGKDTLLMFRDSFANTLIPLMAPQFGHAYFSKLIPYNMTQIETLQPDYVIIERAERHIDLLAENPAIMLAPRLKIEATETIESNTSIELTKDGDFQVIQGWVDEGCIGIDDDVFIMVETPSGVVCYVPFRISGMVNSSANTSIDGADEAVGVLKDGLGAGSTGRISDYGYKAYLIDQNLENGTFTITVLVLRADSGKVVAVANSTFVR